MGTLLEGKYSKGFLADETFAIRGKISCIYSDETNSCRPVRLSLSVETASVKISDKFLYDFLYHLNQVSLITLLSENSVSMETF